MTSNIDALSPIKIESSSSINEIMDMIGPLKTSKAYDSLWADFMTFAQVSNPSCLAEEHFMRFFHQMHKNGLKSSTLWTRYSMINNVYQRKTGWKLQKFLRLPLQLKRYQQGYKRKVAKTFTLCEFQAFMRMELQGPYWTIRKAFAAVAWCGGMRCDELHRLLLKDIHECPDGYKVHYTHSKQLGEEKANMILVPYNRENPSICLASKVRNYLQELGPLAHNKESKLFKGCMRGKQFVANPMGKNLLQAIGKDVAMILGLEDAESYTGHCWRRSVATHVAGQGASTLDMKRQFGWRQDTTAMKYIDFFWSYWSSHSPSDPPLSLPLFEYPV